MNIQPVSMREGQTIQCGQCLKMASEVWSDLDGEAFKAYYCAECLSKVNNKETK